MKITQFLFLALCFLIQSTRAGAGDNQCDPLLTERVWNETLQKIQNQSTMKVMSFDDFIATDAGALAIAESEEVLKETKSPEKTLNFILSELKWKGMLTSLQARDLVHTLAARQQDSGWNSSADRNQK